MPALQWKDGAAYIVKAANNHQALVEALEDVADFLKPRSGMVDLAHGGDASCISRKLKALLTSLQS